jgi:hypothetical protein
MFTLKLRVPGGMISGLAFQYRYAGDRLMVDPKT